MPDYTDIPSLLDGLYALGERLHAALDADDMETFFALVAERQVLAERLGALQLRAADRAPLAHHAEAFAAQHEALLESVATHSRRLGDLLERLGRVRQAQHRYAPPAAPPRRVLSGDVHG